VRKILTFVRFGSDTKPTPLSRSPGRVSTKLESLRISLWLMR
jgi:hypothetical protein